MDLNEISVFVAVVEVGSFARAAQKLAMPRSTVSAKVTALEKRLGLTLIRRTTRQLSVTDVGRAYYADVSHGLRQIGRAEEALREGQAEPRGRLCVTAPFELGGTLLPHVVHEFSRRYPRVQLELRLSDDMVDLVRDDIDLAIRTGNLKDSSLIAKRVGTNYFALFAAPKYLKAAGTPRGPKDLREHRLLEFTPHSEQTWALSGPRGSAKITLPHGLQSNSLGLLRALAIAGDGIVLLPPFFCHQDLGAGRLVRVLPEWQTTSRPVHFVYPQQRFVSPALRAFVEYASVNLKL